MMVELTCSRERSLAVLQAARLAARVAASSFSAPARRRDFADGLTPPDKLEFS